MPKKYLLDTCIWRDFYESRISKTGNTIGSYAATLIESIISNDDVILYSDILIRELGLCYNEEEIINMLNLLFITGILVKVSINQKIFAEAKCLSIERNLPLGDCIFALLAKHNNAILVTRDEHFFKFLYDITVIKKPEAI